MNRLMRYGIILGLCLVVRVAWWLTFQPWADDYSVRMAMGGDPKAYLHFATNLHQGLGYRWLSEDFLNDFPFWRWWYGEYEAIWLPGYPAFLAGVIALCGSASLQMAIAVQIICSVLACALLMRTGEILHSTHLSTVIGIGFSLDPLLANLSLLLLSESVYILCLSVWMYLTARIIVSTHSTTRWYWLLLNAGALAAATWIRVGTVALVPGVMLWLVWIWGQQSLPIKHIVSLGTAWGLCFSLLLVPWYMRNYRLYHTWSLSCIGSFSLLAGLSFRVPSAERYEEYRRLFALAETQARNDGRIPMSLNPFERARYWRQTALREYRTDWSGALYAHLKRMGATLLFSDYANWRRFSGKDWNSSLLTRFAWGWFAGWHLLFLGVGMVALGAIVRRQIPKPLRLYAVGAIALGMLSIFIIINNAEPRGRVTAVLLCLPLMAYALLRFHSKWSEGARKF
ncbi:MAG: hypothetical protein KatS3mg020_0867 [Fimbriimonadales bacterium]|nr:MAG: hypothetical protein KatS3mg020_0867 [Fimbriimonadales bacterium]